MCPVKDNRASRFVGIASAGKDGGIERLFVTFAVSKRKTKSNLGPTNPSYRAPGKGLVLQHECSSQNIHKQDVHVERNAVGQTYG
jgi:hypothetical protein